MSKLAEEIAKMVYGRLNIIPADVLTNLFEHEKETAVLIDEKLSGVREIVERYKWVTGIDDLWESLKVD